MRRLLAAMFAVTVAMGIANLVLPLYARDLGASYTEIGMLGVTYVIFNIILSIPVGRMSDKYGRKLPLGLGMSFMPLVFLLFSWANSVSWILGIRLVQGMAEAPIWVVTQTAVADRSAAGEESKAMGMFGSSWGVGFAVGPVIGGLLYGSVGAGNALIVGALIAAAAAALVGSMSFPKPEISFRKTKLRKLWKPGLLGFIYTGVIGIVIILFPPYGRGLGISPAKVGGLITLFAVIRAIFFVPLGRLADEIGRRKVIIGGLSGIGGAFLALGTVTNFLLLALVLGVLAASGGAVYPATASKVSDIGGRKSRGYAFGIYNAASMAGWGVLPGVGGKVADVAGGAAPYFMSGLIVLAIIPLIWLILGGE